MARIAEPPRRKHEITKLHKAAQSGRRYWARRNRSTLEHTKWAIGKPDLVVTFPAHRVPPTGLDLFPNLTAPTGLTEDRYIKAIQTRPVGDGSRRVVHHAIATMRFPGTDDAPGNPDGADSGGSQFIVEYASRSSPGSRTCKYQCLELIYPVNPSNIMRREAINCANWDYNWHHAASQFRIANGTHAI